MTLASRSGGFTLIEVLIALLVFSVLAFAVTTRISEISQQTYLLERRALAQWIADNQLQRLLLERRTAALAPSSAVLPVGARTERVKLAQRDWQLRTQFIATGETDFTRVEVAVFEFDPDGNAVGPLYTLTTFLGLR